MISLPLAKLERDHHERMAKPVPCEMVLQIPHSICAEIPSPLDLRIVAPADRGHPARAVSAAPCGASGRACDARSHPLVSEYPTEVQRCKHRWISERKVGDKDSSSVSRQEAKLHGGSLGFRGN